MPQNVKTPKPADKPKTEWKGGHLVKKADLQSAAPILGGLALGFEPGRNVAGETAAAMAPHGRIGRSENIAKQLAIVGAPVGGIAALALAKKYNAAEQAANYLAKRFPRGLIGTPEVEREIAGGLVPAATAIGGSMAGGLASGGTVGAIQRLRGPVRAKEVDVPDIYERLIEGEEKEGSAKIGRLLPSKIS